jgi:hypothetical protein
MTMGNEGMVRISTHTRTLAIGGLGGFFSSTTHLLFLYFYFSLSIG